MSYTPEQMAQIDIVLHARFEEMMNIFCAEAAPHDFTRDAQGQYISDPVFGMWAGYIMNYMVIRQGAKGATVEIRPGLLDEQAKEQGRIILL